jgi:hypothetical protein
MTSVNRAQGLPLNTIIIAILALVVLLILMYLTSSKLGWFGKGVANATKVPVCPDDKVKTIAACENPLIGEFVKPDGTKLGYNEVCCAS